MADIGDEVLPNRLELAQPRYIVKDEQRAVTCSCSAGERERVDHDGARFADTLEPQFLVEHLRLFIELTEDGGDLVPPRRFEDGVTNHGRRYAKKSSGSAIGETDLAVGADNDDSVDHPIENRRYTLQLRLEQCFAAIALVREFASVLRPRGPEPIAERPRNYTGKSERHR